jgi:hypothetical protein
MVPQQGTQPSVAGRVVKGGALLLASVILMGTSIAIWVRASLWSAMDGDSLAAGPGQFEVAVAAVGAIAAVLLFGLGLRLLFRAEMDAVDSKHRR